MPTINYIDPVGVTSSLSYGISLSHTRVSQPTGGGLGYLVKEPTWESSVTYSAGHIETYSLPINREAVPLGPFGRLILSTFPPIYTERITVVTQSYARIFPPLYTKL